MGGSVRRSRLLSLLTRTGEEPMLDCRRCRIVDGRNRDAFLKGASPVTRCAWESDAFTPMRHSRPFVRVWRRFPTDPAISPSWYRPHRFVAMSGSRSAHDDVDAGRHLEELGAASFGAQ